jgi:serine/threonine-protein kinase/endoribonuclease IRE1
MILILVTCVAAQLALPKPELILVRYRQVSTMEGKIHAVNPQGIPKWTLETNKPMVSSYYSETAFDETPSPLIPTLQGEIVTLTNGNFIKLKTSIKELIEKPPDIIGNRLYIGEKYMRAYVIDVESGSVLAYHEGTSQYNTYGSSDNTLIGLMEYVYKVLDINTMATIWNITYTEVMSQHKTVSLQQTSFDLEAKFKDYNAITALHELNSNGVISKDLSLNKKINKIKLNNIGSNMLYAELLSETIEGKNVFSLSNETPVMMLEGQSEGYSYKTFFIVCVAAMGLWATLPKKKLLVHVEAGVGTVEQVDTKKIEVFIDKILGHGSQGTSVFEGMFQQRPVAVKRMLKNCIKEAKQEISLLIKADRHPNVVTFFAWEEDDTFVYLAFEKCAGTLADLVSKSLKKKKKNLKFKRPLDLMKLLQEASKGVSYLHRLNIVHRDIKPMNILIDSKGNAKIADMASGKRLGKDVSSFGTQAHGSSGWQPREVLLNERRTKAVDIFSLGCSFYYTMTKGNHPFGSRIQRDNNIISSNYSLPGISFESKHLIEKMISSDIAQRPTADYIYQHCMFWNAQTKLNFLQDLSDLLEAEGNGSLLEIELEQYCRAILNQPWDLALGTEFMANLGKYRKYDSLSIKDLLRVIRNKMHHYHELPDDLKKVVGPLPDGFYSFFDKKFPTMFIRLFDYVEKSKARIYSKYIKL